MSTRPPPENRALQHPLTLRRAFRRDPSKWAKAMIYGGASHRMITHLVQAGAVPRFLCPLPFEVTVCMRAHSQKLSDDKQIELAACHRGVTMNPRAIVAMAGTRFANNHQEFAVQDPLALDSMGRPDPSCGLMRLVFKVTPDSARTLGAKVTYTMVTVVQLHPNHLGGSRLCNFGSPVIPSPAG